VNESALLEAMPKAEVHLHLEGTVSAETLWEMAERNRVTLPARTLAELREKFAFKSFEEFLELWMAMCSCLRTEADFVQLVDRFGFECRRQNIRYVEAHFTPFNHESHGFGGRRALEIVTERLCATESSGGPATRLILDIPGETGTTGAEFTLSLLEELANPLVVALGLGGPERGLPRTFFKPYFERARAAGYPVVAHAGETEGAEHVRQAVNDLRVFRVQHGIRGAEDPETLALLADRNVCCDLALTSNTFLTEYRDLKTHPIGRLLEAGVPITLSTDDPPFFGTDLVREYQRARGEAGVPLRELWTANLNGLRYGLGETPLRRRLLEEFREWGRARGLGDA
jgi:aminodeoxyfutalosine deaminase